MNMAYEVWITMNRSQHNTLRGKCVEVCEAMQKTFPELVSTPGVVVYEVFEGDNGVTRREQHMWLTAPDGELVDPTVSQFSGAALTYYPIPLDDKEAIAKHVPIGRCCHCGDTFTKETVVDSMFCSTSCGDAYADYVFGGVF